MVLHISYRVGSEINLQLCRSYWLTPGGFDNKSSSSRSRTEPTGDAGSVSENVLLAK